VLACFGGNLHLSSVGQRCKEASVAQCPVRMGQKLPLRNTVWQRNANTPRAAALLCRSRSSLSSASWPLGRACGRWDDKHRFRTRRIPASVTKLAPDALSVVYSGFIAGAGQDDGRGIAVDAAGSAYVIGTTGSDAATFPVRAGPSLPNVRCGTCGSHSARNLDLLPHTEPVGPRLSRRHSRLASGHEHAELATSDRKDRAGDRDKPGSKRGEPGCSPASRHPLPGGECHRRSRKPADARLQLCSGRSHPSGSVRPAGGPACGTQLLTGTAGAAAEHGVHAAKHGHCPPLRVRGLAGTNGR
jgi:hypothetical protein